MTAPIIENWTDLKGKLLDSYPSKIAEGFVTLEIKVSDTKPVEGFPNLLQDRGGGDEVIYVNVPATALGEDAQLKPGAKVSCRVRMGGRRTLFAHPERVSLKKT